jgi:phage terminase large subunit-like protein
VTGTQSGAAATIYNGTEPDQLRGPQHDADFNCKEMGYSPYRVDALVRA